MTDSAMALYFFVGTMGVGLLGWFLRNWALTLKTSIEKIHDKMDSMNVWMQDHITTTERRLTRVETKVDMIVLGANDKVDEEADG